jgi:uncharacterized protein YdhG (YjbR/CyaY superfamily)
MTKIEFRSVEEYLAGQPDAAQKKLHQVREAIRKAAPEADEVISYKMPTYKVDGTALIYFAGWKQHYSLYPAGERMLSALKDELAPYEVGKGTIRFPLSKPVPVALIEKIPRFRLTAIGGRETQPAPRKVGRRQRKRPPGSNP